MIILIVCTGLAVAVAVFAYLALHDTGDVDHRSGDHRWLWFKTRYEAMVTPRFGPKRDRDSLGDDTQFHAAPVDVAVPALPPSPLADPPTGTVTTTRLHAIEIHPVQKWAAKAWETVATPMQRQLVWQQHEPPADRGDYSESAWTKREGTQLAILLAEEALDNGFDKVTREVRNFGSYAASGYAPRWEGAA